MAGSAEWRCAATTAMPGHRETFRLERARRALSASVVHHDGQYRAYVR